jgi:hypothetical protein
MTIASPEPIKSQFGGNPNFRATQPLVSSLAAGSVDGNGILTVYRVSMVSTYRRNGCEMKQREANLQRRCAPNTISADDLPYIEASTYNIPTRYVGTGDRSLGMEVEVVRQRCLSGRASIKSDNYG